MSGEKPGHEKPGGAKAGGRKRFYKDVSVAETAVSPPSYRILLDGRGVRTPAKRELAVPSRAIADALAAEWAAQETTIQPQTMPLTRLVNSALDGVAGRETEVRASIVAYGGSDLLCYLAEGPRELIERQSHAWGEIHAWVKAAFAVELILAAGIMPVIQPPAMLARLDGALGKRGALELAALHVMTASMGSLLLSLAVLHRRLDVAQAWTLAHIDEDFQIERWGRDAEAEVRRSQRWSEIVAASQVLAS